MAYNDFALDKVERLLEVALQTVDLFGQLTPLPMPDWLREVLSRGMQLYLQSEKARSEFIVSPILLATRELSHNAVTIFSGQRLDVLPDKGLIGECDFILARSLPVPTLHGPLVTIVEAKKNDIELGMGQCIAQMVGARIFNEREGRKPGTVFGCVTTGEAWQFLSLENSIIGIDRIRYYINDVGLLLAVWQAVIDRSRCEN
jgi:hypothetical protein